MTKKICLQQWQGNCYPSGVTATAPPIQLIYNFFQKQKERKLTLVKQGLFFCIFRYTFLSFMFLLLNVKKKRKSHEKLSFELLFHPHSFFSVIPKTKGAVNDKNWMKNSAKEIKWSLNLDNSIVKTALTYKF